MGFPSAYDPFDPRIKINVMTVDQEVFESTAFVDMTELVIPVKAETMYLFKIRGINDVSAGTGADIKYSISVPTNAIARVSVTGTCSFIMLAESTSTGQINATAADETTYLWGIIITGDTAGNFAPQFSQFAVIAGVSTFMKKGSMAQLIELGPA